MPKARPTNPSPYPLSKGERGHYGKLMGHAPANYDAEKTDPLDEKPDGCGTSGLSAACGAVLSTAPRKFLTVSARLGGLHLVPILSNTPLLSRVYSPGGAGEISRGWSAATPPVSGSQRISCTLEGCGKETLVMQFLPHPSRVPIDVGTCHPVAALRLPPANLPRPSRADVVHKGLGTGQELPRRGTELRPRAHGSAIALRARLYRLEADSATMYPDAVCRSTRIRAGF